MQEPVASKTFTGTVMGTLFVLAVSYDAADLLKTALMAATGALVSFCMTALLKWLKDKIE